MGLRTPVVLALLWGVSYHTVLASPALSGRSTTPSPCGQIVEHVNLGYALHYAIDAYACLNSVPFNPRIATRFIRYINDTIQFQSTLGYLERPPPGYQQPAVDLLSGLDNIQRNVTRGLYRNQYQFEIDVQQLLHSAHDAHLYLTGGITAAFSYRAPYSITTASSDGKSLPSVYITRDIVDSQKEGRTPSPIKTINGMSTVEYLTKLASINAFGGIEPHADWNQLFYTPAHSVAGSEALWDSNIMFYPGDSLSIVLQNGTKYLDHWLALWTEPYSTGPLTMGIDFYNYFVLGLQPPSYNNSETLFNPVYSEHKSKPTDTPSRYIAQGLLLSLSKDDSAAEPSSNPSMRTWPELSLGSYPFPDIQQQQQHQNAAKYGVVSGFHFPELNAAVLSIPSFAHYGYSIGNFSDTVAKFISSTKKRNITRVVIDLQQNGGGTLRLAFSVFRMFFPDKEPFAGSQRRNHQLADIMGEAYTEFFDRLKPDADHYYDYLVDEWVISPRLNAVSKRKFSGWKEYTGAAQNAKRSSTLIERYDLSNFTFLAALFEGLPPKGYTDRSPLDYTRAPFEAKNIVILTDGACSSACALMVEMFTQVGVHTIAVGGRPQYGPMQAVGGTRGAAAYSTDQLDSHITKLVKEPFNVHDKISHALPSLTNAGKRDPGIWIRAMSINLRDQVRANDPVPLQFKYEAADCRIFYTLRNVWNSTQLWHDTVAAAFDDHSLCTKGSTGFSKSPAAAPEPPESQAFPMDWDRNTPELIVHDEDLDLSGGPQDSRRAPQLQPLCDKSGLCKYGTCVVDETKPDCSHIQRCYPRVTKASCPANFIFEARNDVTVSAVKNNFVPEADDIVKVLDITRRAWMVPGKPKSIGTAKPVESHPGQHIKRILRGTCTPKVVPHRGCPQR